MDRNHALGRLPSDILLVILSLLDIGSIARFLQCSKQNIKAILCQRNPKGA